MTPDGLLAHFNRICDAPDSITSLRRFVLDLAVRGKLVDQSDSDEFASDLFQRTRPSSHDGSSCDRTNKSETPYAIPSCWLWVQIGDVLEMINGRAFKPTDWQTKGLPIVRIQNLNSTSAPFNYCDARSVEDRHIIDNGCFLISWSGTPGTSFGAFIWTRGKAALNQHIFKCLQIGEAFLEEYLRLAINGRLDEMIAKAHGGVGLQHITKGKLERLAIPLPPLAEQRRIVAKVDEFMALCDELEAAQAERERRRNRIAAASLARLNQPADDREEFERHVRFHLDHLGRFTTRPNQIPALRQTILNLAVRGRLVSQSSSDESAKSLLDRIGEIKAGHKSAQGVKGNSSAIDDSELPFHLPQNWSWARLGEVIYLVGGQHLKPDEYSNNKNDGPPYVTGPADFGDAGLVITRYALVKKAVANAGQILLTVKGAGVGKTARCNLPEVAISRQLMAVTTILWSERFLLLVMDRLATALKSAARSLIPGISREDIEKFIFAMPPRAEQDRIVAKVDELMAICDELESHLTTAETGRRHLLEAILYEALHTAVSPEVEEAVEAVPQPEVVAVPKNRRGLIFARGAIASYVIDRLHARDEFGTVQLEKTMYLTEAWLGFDMAGDYRRMVAGPLDPALYPLQGFAAKQKWFFVSGGKGQKARYTPGPNIADRCNAALALLGTQLADMDRLLDAIEKMNTEQAELFATVFAAWNDFLLDGKTPTDEEVVREVREHWHEAKQRFTPQRVHECIAWMRKTGFVPRGVGPHTRSQTPA